MKSNCKADLRATLRWIQRVGTCHRSNGLHCYPLRSDQIRLIWLRCTRPDLSVDLRETSVPSVVIRTRLPPAEPTDPRGVHDVAASDRNLGGERRLDPPF